MLNQKSAILFLFFEGFAAIAVQFIFLRQVMPFVGSSVVITSIVISLFLGALALGYKKGGSIQKEHQKVLSSNLFRAAILLGIFASYYFLTSLYIFTVDINPIGVLVLYLLIIMVPLVYYIAQTIPILVNFMKDNQASQKAGNALAFSTIGNMFGGIITTVLIMYYFGISWAVVITVFILFSLSLYVSMQKTKRLLYILFFSPIIFIVNIQYSSLVHVAETLYSNYTVIKDNNATRLYINRSSSSKVSNTKKEPYKYLMKIKEIIMKYPNYSNEAKILVIGAGGFTLNADKKLKGEILYVDIDNKIRDVAEKYFLKEPINGKFNGGVDARVFLRRSKDFFDFIVVDAYFSRSNIPENLTTTEFFENLRKHIKPDGIMIANLIINPYLADKYSKKMDNTIRKSFKSCYTHALISNKTSSTNVLYICTNEEKYKTNVTTLHYTDSNNQPTIDFINHKY